MTQRLVYRAVSNDTEVGLPRCGPTTLGEFAELLPDDAKVSFTAAVEDGTEANSLRYCRLVGELIVPRWRGS
jgi:hypothetical protein